MYGDSKYETAALHGLLSSNEARLSRQYKRLLHHVSVPTCKAVESK